MDSLIKEEPKSENEAPALDKADKEDERRRNAISAAERIGDSTEHDQAGVNRDQIHTNSATDGSSLQQWCSIQGKYWLELQRLQHSIQQILEQTRDTSRKLPARTPTAALEQLRDRIRSIFLDMNAFNKSCSVEMATGSRQTSCSCAAPSWSRRNQRRRTRSEKRACSDT